MQGVTDLNVLLKKAHPKHIAGDYVFCTLQDLTPLTPDDIILLFKEEEGKTIIIRKELADRLELEYSFVAAWITLSIHSSLEAVGLTAAFSTALAKEGVSCNVVAAFYHDHIFVEKKQVEKAMAILSRLSQ